MTPLTLICIVIMLTLLLITAPCTWLIYRYTRPKTQPIKTMLKCETCLVALLLLGTIISTALPQGCTHPMPTLSSGRPACFSNSIHLGGSSALQSLMKEVALSYEHWCPQATINVLGSTSSATNQTNIDKSETGLDSVEDGSIAIGTSDTFASPDKSDLVDHEIAASIFVIILNSSAQITNLTTNEIQGIYAGKYTNWQELGGPDLPIIPLSRGTGSGTRFTFDTYILHGHELLPQMSPISDTPTMIKDVQNTAGAIGYADLHDVFVNLKSLIPISIDGVSASPATVIGNSYKFWTVEHMYTKGQPIRLTQAFIDYMSNDNVRQIIQSFSFIDMHDISSNALSQRCPTNGP